MNEGETIELDERVNIICTMNMSDRTVNELDNAITRRFANELDEYEEDKCRQLFETWVSTHIGEQTDLDETELLCVYLAFTPELANLAIRLCMSVFSSVYGTSVDPHGIVLQSDSQK